MGSKYSEKRKRQGGPNNGQIRRAGAPRPANGNSQRPLCADDFKAAAITSAVLQDRNIDEKYPSAANAEAQSVVKTIDNSAVREDMRHIPFVTIDGVTSRDFDDAVHAEPDLSSDNPGGYIVHVAIADVAWYVRPGSAIDRAAEERGFSIYPPDRAVHMLPRDLSEHACSLKPDTDRYAIVAKIRVGEDGIPMDRTYHRAVIRSRARLTYDGVDAFLNGDKNGVPPVAHALVPPLADLHNILNAESIVRGKLRFNLGKMSSKIDDNGHVDGFKEEERQGSRDIIEEMMCLANRVVAEDLEQHQDKFPAMMRVHAEPDTDRIQKATDIMTSLGFDPPAGRDWSLADLTGLMDDPDHADKHDRIKSAAMKLITRGEYRVNRNGHFGLALDHYCHFTSPIRRYPDLQIHRALISAFSLGEGGLPKTMDLTSMFNQAGKLNQLDQRADDIYRTAMDRYAMAWMYRQKQIHAARLIDVQRDGKLLVGFVGTPLRMAISPASLPKGNYNFNRDKGILSGDNGLSVPVGSTIPARILSCNPLTGRMNVRFEPELPQNRSPAPVPAQP